METRLQVLAPHARNEKPSCLLQDMLHDGIRNACFDHIGCIMLYVLM